VTRNFNELTRRWKFTWSQFPPRDAMRKRGISGRSVSVCPSHTRAMYRNSWRYHQTYFSAR